MPSAALKTLSVPLGPLGIPASWPKQQGSSQNTGEHVEAQSKQKATRRPQKSSRATPNTPGQSWRPYKESPALRAALEVPRWCPNA